MSLHDNDENNGPESDIDPDMLARAEMAISALGDDFRNSVRDRIIDMTRLIDALAATSTTVGEAAKRDALFRHAHELAGQGGTFGFSRLSDIGRSLCNFIDAQDGKTARDDIAVYRAHVAATMQVVNKDLSGWDATDTLLSDLEELIRRHMA